MLVKLFVAFVIFLATACKQTNLALLSDGSSPKNNTESETSTDAQEKIFIPSNIENPNTVIVAYDDSNFDYLSKLYREILAKNKTFPDLTQTTLVVIHSEVVHDNLVQKFREFSAIEGPLPNLEFVTSSTDDVWAQDAGEFGYRCHSTVCVFIESNRRRSENDIGTVIKEIVRKKGISVVQQNDTIDPTVGCPSGDFGGNLESTPDGVVFVGDSMTKEAIQGLRNKLSQTVVVLPSRWLNVSHVDEFINIIPSNQKTTYPDSYRGPRKNYAVMVADPIWGLTLLAASAKDGDTIGPEMGLSSASNADLLEIGKILTLLKDQLTSKDKEHDERLKLAEEVLTSQAKPFCRESKKRMIACTAVLMNLRAAQHIEESLIILSKATPAEDIIARTPALYIGADLGDENYKWRANLKLISLYPNMLNKVVIGSKVIMPDPHNKILVENAIESIERVTGRDNVVTTDSDTYHRNQGGLHCGTQIMRDPN